MTDVDKALAQAFGVDLPAEETPTTDPIEQAPAATTQEPEPTLEDAAAALPEDMLPAEPTETPTETAPETAPAAFDLTSYLKNEFGYVDPNTLKADLASLKTPKEIQFANDESKRIYESLLAGKEDDVADYLYTRKLLKNAENLTVNDKLKLKLKLEYPDFDDEDVENQFEKEYGFNEDDIDEHLIKSEKKKHQVKLKAAAAEAENFFKTYQQKIELPGIAPTAAADAAPQGPTAEEIAKAEQWVQHTINSISSLKAEQASLRTSYVDEANKLKFDVEFVPDQQGFTQAKENAKDLSKWLDTRFTDVDGNLKTAELTQLIYLYENREKVMQGMLAQAKNSILRQVIAAKKGINPADNVQRNYATPPTNELDVVRSKVFG